MCNHSKSEKRMYDSYRHRAPNQRTRFTRARDDKGRNPRFGNANTSRIALSTVTSSLLGSIAIESTPLPRTVPEIVPSPGPGRLLPRGQSTFDPDDHRNIKQHRNHHHLHYIKNNKAYRHPKSQPFQPKNIPSSRTAGTKLSRSCLVFDPGKVLNGQRTVPASLDPSESTHRDPLQPLYSRSQ